MQLTAGKLWGLRRMADNNGIFKMTAVDQRPPIKGPIAAHLGVDEAPWEEVARFKGLLVETLQAQSTAMLLDPHYAIPYSMNQLSPTKGLIVTLEDSLFEESDGGRLSSNIDDWSVAKIKRMGGDAVIAGRTIHFRQPRQLPVRASGLPAGRRRSSDQGIRRDERQEVRRCSGLGRGIR